MAGQQLGEGPTAGFSQAGAAGSTRRTHLTPPGLLCVVQVPKKEKTETWDSNTITPGTPFMHRLSVALQYYVHVRLNSDPGWRGLEVRDNVVVHGERGVILHVREWASLTTRAGGLEVGQGTREREETCVGCRGVRD